MTNPSPLYVQVRSGAIDPGRPTQPNEPTQDTSAQPLVSNPPTRWGDPVVLDSSTGQLRPVGASDTSASIFGALIQSKPTTSFVWPPVGYANGLTDVPTTGDLGVMRKGHIGVRVQGSTAPVRGGNVYVQTTAVAGIPVGTISAVSSANNFQWLNAQFDASGIDAEGNSAIVIF